MKTYTFRVIENKTLTQSVFELSLEKPVGFQFSAGQFIMLHIPLLGPKDKDLRRAYSIATSPEEETIKLCIKLVEGGKGTPFLKALRPGDELQGKAPFGHLTYKGCPDGQLVFIATSTGISPFRSILKSQNYLENPAKQNPLVLFGTSYESEILYGDDLGSLDYVKWVPCLSREIKPEIYKGHVTNYLKALPDEFPWLNSHFYLCGNEKMIKESMNFLKELRSVPKQHIFKEVFHR